MKHNFLSVDYALNLLRRLHNLKQVNMLVKEYEEEFYMHSIRSGQNEESTESVARYVNGLSYAIQDEFNALNFHSVAEAYQVALRIEEKLLRKQQNTRINIGYRRRQQKEKQVEDGESSSIAAEETVGK